MSVLNERTDHDRVLQAAVARAHEDLDFLSTTADLKRMHNDHVDGRDIYHVFDGSGYSPSWRALHGGSRVWLLLGALMECRTPTKLVDIRVEHPYMELVESMYEQTLNAGIESMGLFWDNGEIYGNFTNDEQESA